MHKRTQQGVVLIIVLWFMAIITVMVAALATETRLAAKVVFHNKIGLNLWGDTLKALRLAEMELLITRMPDPPQEEGNTAITEEDPKMKAYRFNGQPLTPTYPAPETVTVRIYDHAGKISLLWLFSNKSRLYELLEKRVGKDLEKLDALYDAWRDWVDRDDLKHANGAEKEYYEDLSPPYEPRNSNLETVGELLLIKGFAEVFEGVNLEAAFTLSSNRQNIDPNLATYEALMLLPELDEATVNKILTQRRKKTFKTYHDFSKFIENEQWARVKNWFNLPGNRTSTNNFRQSSNVYTIAIQAQKPAQTVPKAEDDPDATDESQEDAEEEALEDNAAQKIQQAYMVTVRYQNFNKPPTILMVNPYGVLPDTRHETMPIEDIEDIEDIAIEDEDEKITE